MKKRNTSGLSVRISTFISALLLSLLCGLFYNAWNYEIERIVLEEGGWHSRIFGELGQDELQAIKNFANVSDAVINEQESTRRETAVDITFNDVRAVLNDTPHIAERAGVPPQKTVYHYSLLAMYLIHGKEDPAPRLLFPMFLLITALASVSLILIIQNAFAVSMNAKVRQVGIFSSIGATPKQIRIGLLQEAAALCAAPILTGTLLGIAGCMGLIQLINLLAGDLTGRHPAVPGYHPLVLLLTLLLSVITIWISAWLPARTLSRLTPLDAIKNTGELQLKRQKRSRLLTLFFGLEGKLAGNALKAQKKALRTASLSLVLSSLAFTLMQCFFTTSEISTNETYFERYQDAWDIMVTVKGADIDTFEKTEAIQSLAGVKSAVAYQKAAAKRLLFTQELSEEMKSFGGFSHASAKDVTQADGGWLVNAPVLILDDNSFLAYCKQLGVTPQLSGAVILNRIRDVTNPDFRHPVYMPYVKEDSAASVLRQSGKEEITAGIPVLSYTTETPVLREEYASKDYYECVHFLPVSLWNKIKDKTGGAKQDVYIRILSQKRADPEELETLQRRITSLIGPDYVTESENRIREYETNSKQVQGMRILFGGFCVLLAVIGIGDVFSNTLSFVHQRKREFARYLSVGMTPNGLKKMFFAEAIALAGRPLMITLPLSAAAVWYMLRMSYLEAGEFLAKAPLLPIAAFLFSIIGSVALAYYCAWKNVCKISLAEILKDDTML